MVRFLSTKKSASSIKFLSTKEVASVVEDIIKKAKQQIVLVSPYLDPSEVDIGRLKQANNRGVRIKLIYGKRQMKPDIKKKLDNIKNLEIFYNNELHAKCYFNENTMVITSLNYLDYSERTNWEMGILIRKPEDHHIFEEALREVEIIEEASELQKTIGDNQELETNSDEHDALKMEYIFEHYIHRILCSEAQFNIEQWNTDYHKDVECSKRPDFLMKFKPTKKRFAIECKYVQDFDVDKKFNARVLDWASREQIKAYCDYSSKHNIPITIVIGLGGKPNKPESVYCIPFSKEMQFPTLYPSKYIPYKRSKVDKKFFLKENGFVE